MRRSAGLLISLLALLPSSAAFAYRVEGSVFLMPITTEFKSVGNARFLNDLNQQASATLTGTHSVSGPQVFVTSVQADDVYFYILEGPAQPGACYGTSLQVTADPPGSWFHDYEGSWSGDTRCAPGGTGGGGGGGGGSDDFESEECDTACPPNTPIVINVGGGAYRFSSADNGVSFDIDADGDLERVAWPSEVHEVGFLFLDRNDNGIPDSGSELFGDHTPLMNGQTAEQGFEALAELDSNRDGVISQLDAAWVRLALWRDFDRNGIGGSGEISPLSSLSINGLHLDPKWIGRRDRHGNAFRLQAHLDLHSGAARPYYDVYLTTIQ